MHTINATSNTIRLKSLRLHKCEAEKHEVISISPAADLSQVTSSLTLSAQYRNVTIKKLLCSVGVDFYQSTLN